MEIQKGDIIKRTTTSTIFASQTVRDSNGAIVQITSKNTGKLKAEETFYEVVGQRKVKAGIKYTMKDIESGMIVKSMLSCSKNCSFEVVQTPTF